MTLLEEPTTPVVTSTDDASGAGAGEVPTPTPAASDASPPDTMPPVAALLRPVLAASLASAAAGLTTAGIFGSWSARGVAVLAAAFGAGWALLTQRSRNPTVMHVGLAPAIGLVSAVLVTMLGGSAAELPTEIGDALESGRAFRPPVPFDPGWGPLLFFAIGALAFGAAWAGTALQRPMLAVGLPLPVVALTSISQPEGSGTITAVAAFVPVLAGLAVLFGGDSGRAGILGADFELKRALRGAIGLVPLLVGLIALNQASFLFPEPVFDPTDRPQKPRAVPLSAAQDRVLFEVVTDDDVITGPWRTGVLDVYDGESWRLPPYDNDRYLPMPAGGQLTSIRSREEQTAVTITIRDLGDSPVFPGLPASTSTDLAIAGAVFDPRAEIVRMESGRIPTGTTYTVQFPGYPDAAELRTATATQRPPGDVDLLEIPKPPAVVDSLLRTAPDNAWERLDLLRQRLLKEVTASGAGAPVDISPDRVADLLEGSKEGSPFEIVAAEAMLARWAGVPSRIGFGFDGLNVEDDLLTVRPQNSAQWLEVYFDDYGWVPLIGQPEKAQADLDNDPARFNDQILPSDDVAVELFVLYETDDLTLLYERIRARVLRVVPFAAGGVAIYFGWPALAKTIRRSRRRRWARTLGPQAMVAVEYAELRDLAIDLTIGDDRDLPLEWLYKVMPDEEHLELAWLAARVLYGDMRDAATEADADAAEKMSTSVRRRLGQAQPMQSRMLAAISRASIDEPYNPALPNISALRLPRVRVPAWRVPQVRVQPLLARLPGRGGA